MKVIMYHYVRPNSILNGNLKHLTVDQFNRQLDFFQKEYGFLTPDNFRYNFEKKIESNKIILTFDDGLLDHYRYVFPILKERGLKGLFFIPSFIFKNNSILNVHKIHYLLAKFNSKKIYEDALLLIKELKIRFKHDTESEAYKYSVHEEFELKVKRLFNYNLYHKDSNQITDNLFNKYNISKDISKQIYLNKNHLTEMFDDGHIIGSHTISHQVLSTLDKKSQTHEIEKSFNTLSEFYSSDFKTISYPFGYKFTYNKNTLEILEEQKVNYGFIFDNEESKVFNRYEISRIDCNKYIL
tara:strand:+ start:4684 stop:5574 length:891 start_codon:yes stop_codon:yes gene_type:complete